MFVLCVSNEIINFAKESAVFCELDPASDAYNPVFEEKQATFGNIDTNDESSYCLLALVKVREEDSRISYQISGINAIPLTIASDTVMSGVFEVPMIDLPLNQAFFSEFNSITGWQFQHRVHKDKKATMTQTAVIYRQSAHELSVRVFLPQSMFASPVEPLMVNKMFLGLGDPPKSSQQNKEQFSQSKVSQVILPAFKKLADKQNSVREYIKECMNQ